MKSCFLLLISLLWLAGCSTLKTSDDPSRHIANDPFEGLNRSVWAFNDGADKLVLRPVAHAYRRTMPKPAQGGIKRFFSNLREPISAFNNLLQGEFDRALRSTFRFSVNSTLGLFGVFDVAKSYGVHAVHEDFGQTLATWGVGPGPYIMLPLVGPTNLRDGVGRISDTLVFYPFNQITDSDATLTGLVLVDILALRVSLLGSDKVLDQQLDPYAFLKAAVEKSRIDDIYNDKPPYDKELDYDF